MTITPTAANTPGKRAVDETYREVARTVYLPQDVLQRIFACLPFKSIGIVSRVDNGWNLAANEKLFTKQIVYRELTFTPYHWNVSCGEVVIDDVEVVNGIPMLPDNIFEILKRPSLGFPGKSILETHTLIYIPKSICGVPLTLLNFNEFLKEMVNVFDLKAGYKYIWDDIFEQEGDLTIESGYILMPNEVLPESRNKRLKTQKRMVERLNIDDTTKWRIPKLLEVIVCVCAKYLMSNEILFGLDPCTFVLCQERMRRRRVMVGGFDECGFFIGQHFCKAQENAVAPFWKL